MLELLGLPRRRRRRVGAAVLLVAGSPGPHYGGPTATAQLVAIEQQAVANAMRTFTQSLPAPVTPSSPAQRSSSRQHHRSDRHDQQGHR